MGVNPSLWNATGYNSMILRTVQLQGGEMRKLARMATGDLYHEYGIYPRITGGGLPTKITTRAPTTPNSEPDYTNRRVSRGDYHDAVYIDRQDIDRMQADPRYEKNQILLDKFALLEDIVFQQALLGSADGGDSGTTATAFDTDNIIPILTGAGSGITTAAGFNYEKHKAGIRLSGENLVNLRRKRPTIVMGWQQWSDAMDDDHYTNYDYTNTRRVDSNVAYFPNVMGTDFIVYEQVPYMASASAFNIDDVDYDSTGQWQDTDDTEQRACFMTFKDCTLLEIKPDVITEMGKNPARSYRMQVYMEMGLGAVRMQEEDVVVLPCSENPS